MSYEDRELEEIRRRKLEEWRRIAEEERRRREEEEALEARREAFLRSILTTSARQRLANLKLVRPEVARIAEDAIIQLVQTGRLSAPVTEDQVKDILMQLDARNRRSFQIRFMRK